MATHSRIQAFERATGRDWDDVLAFLERIGAADLGHKEIALALEAELAGSVENAGWWAQGGTIAYEQLIGRRVPGQASDGTFRAGVTRSTSLGMRALMDAWSTFASQDDAVRALVQGEPRTSGTEKRLTWRTKSPDGGGVVVTSEPKEDGTATLGVELTGLASPEVADQGKRHWTEIIEGFIASPAVSDR